MIFRLRLDVEIDTTTRQTRVIHPPLLMEGEEHRCLHCKQAIPLKLIYCNAECFRAHGKRPRRKLTAVAGQSNSESLIGQFVERAQLIEHEPAALKAKGEPPRPALVDYGHFSFPTQARMGAASSQ